MAQSDLQRIAADLVAYFEQARGEVGVLVEIHNATIRNANLLGVLSHRAAGDTRSYVGAAAVELAEASKAVRRAAELLEDSSGIALGWARQAVLDTASGHRVPARPVGAGPTVSEPLPFESLLPGLDPDDELVEEVAKLPKPEQERWQKVFATYPGRDAPDTAKASWYRTAADGENVPEHMRRILRGKAFHYDVAHHFLATEVTINKVGKRGEIKQRFFLDGMTRREVVSLKNAQLWDVSKATAKGYVNEMLRKYNPLQRDLIVAGTEGNKRKISAWGGRLIGRRLRGDMVLGVPPQDQPIPQWLIDYGEKRGVEIRPYSPNQSAGGPS
ncbi:hypothetical protein ACFT2C_06040 [Promicromonospora sp. NPDC057138]|uniref:hypothetical protein n=1 Tax=Promicromonospora sp. NPDC057138 TaxID=3346031 RepID=UPI0036372B87